MSWTGAILACKETGGQQRAFDLTLRSSEETWDATDPKAVLVEDSGRLDVQAGIAACYDSKGKIFLKLLGVGDLAAGSSGVGSYGEGEPFTWDCVKLV
jgi:hypothetical protein